MLYKDFLKTIKTCPFCKNEDRWIKETKTAFLTYSLAPYAKHHLLVIPKRHVTSFTNLKPVEEKDIDMLIMAGMKLLHKLKHKNISILTRDGDHSEKSVEHLHYHLIPNHRIGDIDARGNKRRVMSEKEVQKIIKDFARVRK